MSKGTSIKDSIHGLIQLSAYERKIISTPGFNRLHDVYQNSTLYMTFPCNRTKRYEHSIGTMKLCSDMFYQSVLNANKYDRDKFYECAQKHIESIINEINNADSVFDCDSAFAGETEISIGYLEGMLERDELRKSFIPNGVPEKYFVVQIILMEAVRTAALLHDVGHPPFSHIIEFALKNTYENVSKKNRMDNELMTQREKEFLDALNPCFNDREGGRARKLHEHMGDIIAKNILFSMVDVSPQKSRQRNKDRSVENVFAAIVYHAVMGIFHDDPFFAVLHRLIDSDVDGDRLDYLTRDPENSGVDVGRIDYNRIISGMRLCCMDKEDDDEKENSFFFCFPTKAIHSLEDIFRRRFNLYSDIVYHHHVTKTDYLLMSSVELLVEEYLSSTEEPTEPEVPEMIPFDISGLWHPLLPNQKRGRLKMNDNLVQWNDSWLMTVLKQIYYRDYVNISLDKGAYDKENINARKIYKQLSELLLNEKYYVSLTKRSNNFKILDNEIKRVLREKGIENVEGTVIRELARCCSNDSRANSFVAQFLCKRYGEIHENGKKRLYEIIEQAAAESLDDTYGNVEDFIIAPVNISVGLGDNSSVFFYDIVEAGAGERPILSLSDVSDIADILNYELELFPPFYVYVALDEPEKNTPRQELSALKKMGVKIAEGVFRDIESCLPRIPKSRSGPAIAW